MANELLNRYKLPKSQIATWVCIAYQESRLETTAINKETWDYGIFQISSKYWCTKSGPPGNECGITCESLLDDDISNDVKCARLIYKETAKIQGDGFNAWVTYHKCKDPNSYVQGCF